MDIGNCGLKIFSKCRKIWFWVKKEQEIIINGDNADIKAVRYTQITDDDKDTGKQSAVLKG